MGAEEARRPRPCLVNHRARTHSVAREDHPALFACTIFTAAAYSDAIKYHSPT